MHDIMQKLHLISGCKPVLGMLVVFGLAMPVPLLLAQQDQAGSNSPQASWFSIQQLVKNLETAVQSKNLHGMHENSGTDQIAEAAQQYVERRQGSKIDCCPEAIGQFDHRLT